MSKDLYELSAELNGVSTIVSGLSNQLDDRESDILTPQSMKMPFLACQIIWIG